MNTKFLLQDVEKLKTLAERLECLKEVAKYSNAENKEGWTVAHGLSDIEISISRLLNELFPKIRNEKIENDELNDLLLDIGEEFRHIIYHLKDIKYYGYLSADYLA